MKYIASTIIANSKGSFPLTLEIQVNSKGRINIEENSNNTTKPKAWQLLDLLAEIMPNFLYSEGYEVELGRRPIKSSGKVYSSQPCLVLRKSECEHEKYYLLEKIVGNDWMCSIPVFYLRILVNWWRINRDSFPKPAWDWEIFRNEN